MSDAILALVITIVIFFLIWKIIAMAVIALAGLGGAVLLFCIVWMLLKLRKH